LHVTALGASIAVLGDLKLAPEPEPFTWEVSLVETSQPEAAQPSVAQPAPQPPIPEPPVKPEIVQPVQKVEPLHHKVALEAPPPTIEPKIQEIEKPVETIHEAATVIPRSVEPVEVPQPAPVPVAKAETPIETKSETKEVARTETAPPVLQAPPTPPVQPQTVESAVPKEPAPPAPIQEATLRPMPAKPGAGKKADFGWLAQILWDRVARLKRYPHSARLNHMEGRVVIRAVITDDGQLAEANVSESSGHSVLDADALEVIRRACPLKLRQPLGRRQVVVQVPINYRLEN
ncbi:MAG TPA: TonB family protein, partial [Nitrospiraceae bacterium]|nr:TonB family protein [Nitrospiraceae bacterium]